VNETDWESQVAAAWESFDDYGEAGFLALIEKLAAERPAGDSIGFFERASSLDATGHPDVAIPLYEQALAAGLPDGRRRQAVIQLASSLRLAGRPEESAALLMAEIDAPSGQLNDELVAFLALTLADLGREREAASAALAALAPHLSRYQVSVANYARQMVEPGESPG
jgi:hypothetical protein